METRNLQIALKRLTENEIQAAIQENISEDTNLQNENEDDLDTFTDSESDHCSDFEENSSDEDENIEAVIERSIKVYKGKDNTEWTSEPQNMLPTNTYRRSTSLHKVHLIPGQRLDYEIDSFRSIINNDIISIIVRYTNKEAKKTDCDWKDTNQNEIIAFIGLLIAAGVDQSNNKNYEEFFDVLLGIPLFRATMGLKRFKAILRYIRFDDKETRSTRRMKDKLAPIRDLFDLVCNNLKRLYSPGENLTVDEQLMGFRGRCSFKQYLPSKPDKYGLKIFWICDAKTWYPLYGIPYLGRERSGSARRTNIALTTVSELCKPYYRTNRNITFDNYFTSYELAQHLKSNGLTCVGTVRKNKKFIPPQFLANRSREEGSNLFGFRGSFALLSHVPRKNKAVIFLSTLHHSARVEDGKAEINTFYNETKGGVDVLDKLCHSYSVQRKTNRWPLAYFMNLINVAGIASYVIWRNINNRFDEPIRTERKIYLKQLALQLTYEHIKSRSLVGLSKPHQETIQRFVVESDNDDGASTSTGPPPAKKARRRCHLCPSKLSRKVKQTCDKCRRNVCSQHAISTLHCQNCAVHSNENATDLE